MGRRRLAWGAGVVVAAAIAGPFVGSAVGTHEPPPPGTYSISFEITTGPNAGPYEAAELPFTYPIYLRPDHQLNGPTVFGGYGCDADNDIPSRASAGLRPLGPDEEAILVLQEGPVGDAAHPYPPCDFDEKAQNAIDAGYDGVIIASRHRGSEAADDLSCEDGEQRDTSGACVVHEAMHRIFGETPSYEQPYAPGNNDEPQPGQLGEDVRITGAYAPPQAAAATTVTSPAQTVVVTQTQTQPPPQDPCPPGNSPGVTCTALPGGAWRIVGTPAADRLVGGAAADLIYGEGGDDRALGLGGGDRLFGFAGDDVLIGGDGDDRLSGGDGEDRVLASAGDDVGAGGGGSDRLGGGDGDDRLLGGFGDDAVAGGRGLDALFGGGGFDRLFGGDGADRLGARDGVGGEVVSCGRDEDRAATDPSDRRFAC